MIEYSKRKKKWILYTKDGSRILGTHSSYEDALLTKNKGYTPKLMKRN